MSGSTSIPSNWSFPGIYFNVSASSPTSISAVENILVIGQALANTGTSPVLLPVDITQTKLTYGIGSQVARLVSALKKNDIVTTSYVVPLADSSGGTKATGTITATVNSPAAGTIPLYVNGTPLQIATSTSDTSNSVASNISAAINTASDLGFTAAVSGNVVTLTAKHSGVEAGLLDLQTAYYDTAGDEQMPMGVSLAFSVTPGTGDPDLAAVLANIANSTQTFDAIYFPYGSSLSDITEMDSYLSARWSYTQQLFGMSFTALNSNYAGFVANGTATNTSFVSTFACNSFPTPADEVGVAVMGACTNALNGNPAQNLQNIIVNGVLPPKASKQLNNVAWNTVTNSGMSFGVTVSNQLVIKRIVTHYTSNPYTGQPDLTFAKVNTRYKVAYALRYINAGLGSTFPNSTVVPNGSLVPPNSAVITPNTVLGKTIALARELEALGILANVDNFAKNATAVLAPNGRVVITGLALKFLGGNIQTGSLVSKRTKFARLVYHAGKKPNYVAALD